MKQLLSLSLLALLLYACTKKQIQLTEENATADKASLLVTSNFKGVNRADPDDMGFGYYEITNRNSGMSLDVNGGSTANGAGVIQWPYNGGRNQQWQVVQL